MKDTDIYIKPAPIHLAGDIEDELIPLSLHVHKEQVSCIHSSIASDNAHVNAGQMLTRLDTISAQLERLIAIIKRSGDEDIIY